MSRTLDVEKIDAALKRAAYRAIHGTREERSGRFLVAKKENVSSVNRASKHPESREKAKASNKAL